MQKVFEHTIDLSGHANLTRELLWAGLEDFAHNPHEYVESMQASRVSACPSDDGRKRLARELDFGGALVVSDVAELLAPERLTTLVPASGPIPESRLDITIEEDEAGAFKLHFEYFETPNAEAAGLSAAMQGLRQKAWLAKDQSLAQQLLAALCD